MRVVTNILAATAALTLSLSTASMAQDDDGPQKYENAEYLSMVLVDYKPGMRTRALEIIDEHFVPAAKKAGVPPVWAMHMQTGGWDAVFFWSMKNGPADMEWFRSPNDVKWMAAFAELEGGKENAGKLMKEYQSMVARTNVMIGHHHSDEMEKEE